MKFKLPKNKKITKFEEKHRDCGFDDIGTQFKYSFTPTIIGVICEVKCIHCGKKKIIEDLDMNEIWQQEIT